MHDKHHIDFNAVDTAVQLLRKISPDARLLGLKNLCINNGGIWTVPEMLTDKRPCLFEAWVYGIPAIGTCPEDLPRNWMTAADNALNAHASA
ncbi:hypothetical protein J7426_14450 [Tropicibacter sp. R16_0]|uniref:hypothetical protein n=1 Tax=Tropicibacter sp. R16_0 TaxID=2821102 RepID=UPI001ADAE175|nr:hypothetical protein [Tropicibacter sp. R16_0]MBO9451471.1 hypothetical protein [Tropicibacter sp. R16_0]